MNCAIKSDGRLFCWGDNAEGALGNNTTVQSNRPLQEFSAASNWTRVSAGQGHTCALKTSGALYCWGSNMAGESAQATDEPVRSPSKVGVDLNWDGVSTGGAFTCATKTHGALWCWGKNTSGQLGDGTTSGDKNPRQEIRRDADWTLLSTGDAATCAIKTNGTLWCWGKNLAGQLGDGTTIDKPEPVQESSKTTDWKTLSMGEFHACAIKTNGTLWCWGSNGSGRLGNGGDIKTAPAPVHLE